MTIRESLFWLNGDVALMCGVGGIGHVVAQGLAQYGAQLMVADLSKEAAETTASAIRTAGHEVAITSIDVTDEASVEETVGAAMDRFGKIDILVNTVGYLRYAEALEMPTESWRRIVDVNLTGAFLLARACARRMAASGGGRIVNFISGSHAFGTPDMAPYAAAKAALVNLTKTLAIEWYRYGIRVNAVSPGMTETSMTTEWLHAVPGRLEDIARRIPAGRLGQPEDFVGPVIFLVSRASEWILGQTLHVDGGIIIQHPLRSPVAR